MLYNELVMAMLAGTHHYPHFKKKNWTKIILVKVTQADVGPSYPIKYQLGAELILAKKRRRRYVAYLFKQRMLNFFTKRNQKALPYIVTMTW